jgi:Cu2+-exporting ATPase
VVRTPDAFERLAQADVLVLDDDIELGRAELEVAAIETQMDQTELLRYAASAFRHLDDDRVAALVAACRQRRIHLLDLPPAGFEPGVTVIHGGWRIRVREHPVADDGLHPLVVELNGKAAGLIAFARSERPAAASALSRIRALGPVTIALVSERSEAQVAARAALLGADLHVSRSTPSATARLLQVCRDRGLKTAFVGRCRLRSEAAALAHVAVSICTEGEIESDPAAVLLFQPRLDPFADLWEIARSHEARLRTLQRLIVIPNLFCVAGAFFFGATALTAVMLSNLGTFGLYSSAIGGLHAVGPAGRRRVRVATRSMSRSSRR